MTPGQPVPRRRSSVRLAGLLATGASVALLTQCTTVPSPPTGGSTTPASTPSSRPARALGKANVMTVDDLDIPIGGGSVKVDDKNARSLDHLSICQQQPLSTLGSTGIRSQSFKDHYSGGRPFPHSVLDDQPDTYTVALQFPTPADAERAQAIVHGWVISCRSGVDVPQDVKVSDQGFDWTPVIVRPGTAEIAEVVYREPTSTSKKAIWESIGLTRVEDRMMLTVHLYFTDESPYSTNLDDDESGFAHPQVSLVRTAASRLAR